MGVLITLTGPSGSGKTSLTDYLVAHRGDLFDRAVGCTTRKKRVGEVHGQDYFFLDDEEFDLELENDQFVEWAEFAGHRYGTRKKDLKQQLDKAVFVFYSCDPCGALQIYRTWEGPKYQIFITATEDVLHERLVGRAATDEEKQINLQRIREDRKRFDLSLIPHAFTMFDFILYSQQNMTDHLQLLRFLGI